MRKRNIVLMAIAASMAPAPAQAQFSSQRQGSAVGTQQRQPASAPAQRRQRSLAEQQRAWATEATRSHISAINGLPRSGRVPTNVQTQITSYAPSRGTLGYAQAWTADDCERSIRRAEVKYGLPPSLLAAIALTESGYNGRPNPFAMNIAGRTYHASSTADMERKVSENGGVGASIDVGCLQINLRWHAGRFRDWRSLLAPGYNAEYAALYLTELKRRYGTWNAAVGAYHSRTPWRSANYACLVSRRWSQIYGSVRSGCGADIEAMSRLMYATQRR